MEIVRYAARDTVHIGIREEGKVAPLRWATSMGQVLARPLDGLRELLDDRGSAVAEDEITPLPPIDGRTEVWAAGVTYERSRSGRVEESSQRSVYERVYDAERPELFLKAVAWRVVTDGEPVAVRADSALDVPEPELAAVVNRFGEIVGYAVCNDMSSRSIEGENPLYLPQAKIYGGSCALATGIVPAWEVPDPHALAVRMRIRRGPDVVWSGETGTDRLHRRIEDLVGALCAPLDFPEGAVLATGTGIVPELGFGLAEGDRVEIEIPGVGALSNPVVRGREAMSWLTAAAEHPARRSAP